MEYLEKLAAFFGIIFLLIFVFSIKSCQCQHRSGDGIQSEYHPIYGCMFSKKETND